MLQWTSESCTEKNLTESGVNLVSCNSILIFFSYICIIKFYRSRSLEWSHCYWVSNRYTVFWRIYIRLVVSGLNACEPLESLWYTLQFNHSSLFNQLRQNWADPTLLLDRCGEIWNTVSHCFRNMLLLRRCEGWSRAQCLWQLHGKDLPVQCYLRTLKHSVFLCVGVLEQKFSHHQCSLQQDLQKAHLQK